MKNENEITIPYKFIPRDYQLPLFHAFDNDIKRAVIVWARRHGKDLACWNLMLKKAYERVGNYFYIFPSYTQSRKSFWDNITEDGKSFLDFCPKLIIKKRLDHEMKIFLDNGSIIQVVGSDKPDSLRGSNPCGVVLSEFAYQNPSIWISILDPILTKNNGWSIFNSTPNGKNYFYTLLEIAIKNPKSWYSSIVTIEDSKLIDPDVLKVKIDQGISQEMIDQEYYCSFETGVLGSIYGRVLKKMIDENRLCYVPYDKDLLVYTAWDLGYSDSTAIIFFQIRGNEILILDYYEDHGWQLEHYLNVLRAKKYNYATHFIPHDGRNHTVGGDSFLAKAEMSEFNFSVVKENILVTEGIEKVRTTFYRIFMDKTKCDVLYRLLLEYHYVWDDNLKVFRNKPLHNYASHAADAFRYLVLSLDQIGDNNTMSKEQLRGLKRKYLGE